MRSTAASTWASCGSRPAVGSRKTPIASCRRTTSRPTPAGRPEVHDLDRDAPPDAVQPADPLFHRRRVPRQVEEHQAAAELEVAALAAAFGGDQQAWAAVLAEARHLEVAARRRQVLVEDAGGELRAVAERRPQHLQRFAVGDEDQCLLPRVTPARRVREQPRDARVAGVHGFGLLTQRAVLAPQHGRSAQPPTPARDGCDRSSGGAPRVRRRRASHGGLHPRVAQLAQSRSALVERHTDTPTRGGRPPMSARRVELVHGASGVPCASRASKSGPPDSPRDAAAATAGRSRARRVRAASR